MKIVSIVSDVPFWILRISDDDARELEKKDRPKENNKQGVI